MSSFVEIDIDFDYCGEVDMVLAHDEGGEHEDVKYYRDRGECEFLNGDVKHTCSVCGWSTPRSCYSRTMLVPNYCPNCGRKVVG